jgi:prevent-host-death family protein
MYTAEDIKPVTYLKTRSSRLIRQIAQSRRPVAITQNGKVRAVVIDAESYETLHKTLLMLKLIAQGEADIKAGRTMPFERAVARVRRRIRSRAT